MHKLRLSRFALKGRGGLRKASFKGAIILAVVGIFMVLSVFAISPVASAEDQIKISKPASGSYQCGSGKNAVKMSINIGCYGAKCQATNSADGCSALLDATFAIIRILSAGVGIVIVISTVWAGIQYTTSRGDPSGTQKAVSRLINNAIALLIFIFGYAILNFIIPAGFFK